MQHVYIVGSKGIPAQYGGFETFVDKLTEKQTDSQIRYHVASLRNNSELSKYLDRFEYNGADVFSIDVPNLGPAKAIVYDIKALKFAINDAKEQGYQRPIFYVLASRIGPFIGQLKREITRMGGVLYLNPDGHEWKRAKWSKPVRTYWKYSEKYMVKHADLVIADNPIIEDYIRNEYQQYKPMTTYIAYGTDVTPSSLDHDDAKVRDWYEKFGIEENNYYLIVGRFVPENNYETMIREFMKSNSHKDLVVITNVEHNAFYQQLIEKTHFDSDKRIKFAGTMYDQDLLKYIRENAFAYFHGHEVGGTNPSLLEAMATTQLNLLVDVGFNRAVAGDSAIYWNKNSGDLAQVINQADSLRQDELDNKQKLARKRVKDKFAWPKIVTKYEHTFVE